MRKSLFLLIAAAAVAASPAAAQQKPKLGQRTARPETSMAGIGGGSSDAEVAQELAAAANFPVGSLQNPVRVAGPEGERAYLARLRCTDGAIPRVGAQRPGGTDGFGNVADLAPVDCGGAAPAHADILIDLYQEEHVLEAAPAGFQLAPR
ncbi:MAG TPA: hypothetical protein VH331_00690 [Allosphingosinicella sp.]|jgi:hypothetical protein|nr:hypothetical protein [Allosphingosinicella sp.]